MKQYLLKIGILVIVIMINTSCKKYDEGPWISLRSKENRMDGVWNINKYMVNGYDSTSYFNKYEEATFRFNIDWSGQLSIYCTDHHINPNPRMSLSSRWYWDNNKQDILIEIYDSNDGVEPPFSPLAVDNTCDWEIKKLKKKEFYLETTDNGIHYRLELKR